MTNLRLIIRQIILERFDLANDLVTFYRDGHFGHFKMIPTEKLYLKKDSPNNF